MIKGAVADKGLPFQEEYLEALAVLEMENQSKFINVREALKKSGVPVGRLDSALASFKAASQLSPSETSYEVINNCIYMHKVTTSGLSTARLTNFHPRIVKEILKDDGSGETVRSYIIEAIHETGDSMPAVELPVSKFESMNWIGEQYGAKAFIAAGQATKDNIRAATIYLSKDIEHINVFSHTGWKNIDGKWHYLTASGAVGAEGINEDIKIDLSEAGLNDYALPTTPDVAIAAESIRTSLKLISVAPLRITYALLAAIYLAPLGEVVQIAFSVFIEGHTGTRKTELAAICQGHYGENFHGKNLPGNWASTANSIEKLTFLIKDAICIIDDFFPGNTQSEVNKINAIADRVLRAQGNLAGRKRMKSDTSFRETYHPRGLIISTGEDVPKGQSLRGRMLILELGRNDVNLSILTELQTHLSQGWLAAAMRLYVQWLAPKIDGLKESLPEHRRELREDVREAEKTHSRTPEIISDLTIGLEAFFTFAEEMRIITAEEKQHHLELARKSLIESAVLQEGQQKNDDPVELFRNLLNSAFTSGLAHLESVNGGAPQINPERWGWKNNNSGNQTSNSLSTALSQLFSESQSSSTDTVPKTYSPKGKRIGWTNGLDIYFDPEAVYGVAQQVANSIGKTIGVSDRMLRKRLDERGFIQSKDGNNTTTKKRILGMRPRVLHISVNFFDDGQNKPGEFKPAFSDTLNFI